MRYFDLHVHPSTKSSLCQALTAWDEVKIYDDAPGWIRSFRNVIDSQANLTQLSASNYELIVAPLVGLEKAFARNLLIKNILPKHSALDKANIKGILDDHISYHQSFMRDFNNLASSIAARGDKAVLVKSAGDYDATKLNVLISVEGAHCFDDGGANDPVENFRTFRRQHRVFYFTLTHLSRANACNHAYGVRVKVSLRGASTDEEVDDVEFSAMGTSREFAPWGKGFFQLGANLVKECYSQPKDEVTLVDVKHMSFYARQYLYAMRAAHGWTNIPLVASHMGVTGTSWENSTYVKRWARGSSPTKRLRFWRRKGLGTTLFNPWTINLYDEDILLILQSKGLIGVSFDQRIVGAGKIYPELFSHDELNAHDALSLYRYLKKSRKNPDPEKYVPWNEAESGIDNEESFRDGVDDLFGEGDLPEVSSIASFINNLLHIIKVGLTNGYDGTQPNKVNVWDHVCIGSDLDGLVDSLDFAHDKFNSVTAKNISLFVERIRVDIKIMAAYDPGFNYQINDIDNKLEKLFYSNGKDFATKFLNGTLF
jgi:microsomal dipeptidase-like Zn-dependent dipeptidase